MGPLVATPRVLREFGVDPMEIMASLDLEPALFDDPENIISFATMGRLLKRCAAETRCPHFGLLIGQRMGPACLGLVGQLLQHLPDVGSALRGLVLNLHLHDQGAVPVLSVEQGMATLCYAIYQGGVEGADQIYDGAIAITFNILRALCGPAWLPTEVLFSHRRPSDVGPYRRFFQAPLRFDREQTALIFPATWLKHPLPDADPKSRRQIEQRIAALEDLNGDNLTGQLRRVLRILLVTRRTSLAQVAQLFSIHRRTLNRRLEERGVTFQALVDEVRYEIARQLLENTGMSICQIAATLDYSDPSAFTRAFRRWSGTTPAAWRTRPLTDG
ncbi:MAG: AraC family transcriptional regulator [Candidatus Contendobacter sp.]|nr:AraC family transcriptional regulator [Candidatus Contendobacter sp.]MDS4059109.1 AraC family transcriptional regulator [Candidatus Contendobacter sp.]